ncbi:MAG: TraR/DksA family transcriptional regulator [Rhodospirillales bacterium]|nr:TraR/DksA family transcriptional regulator [Rhodospirillales bacterium]
MTKRPDIDLDDLRRRLIARREELLRLAEAAKEGGKPVELDQTAVGRLSRMDALQVQAMALETERRRTAELARIDAALHRVDVGDFGYCLRCDEAIPTRRLELDPTTALCVACAQGREE